MVCLWWRCGRFVVVLWSGFVVVAWSVFVVGKKRLIFKE